MGRQAEKKAKQAMARKGLFTGVAKGVAGRPVHAVQVGANDGKLADPILEYFEDHGWHGLLLEPNPVYFARLQARHAERDGVVPVQVGCSSAPAQMTLYSLTPEFEDLYREDARGCATLDRDRMVAALAKGGREVPDDHVTATTIDLRPLDDILAEHGITETDVLVIDVEGHEPEVLAGCDLARLRPKVAFVEINTREHRWPTVHTFRDHGYQTFKLAVDLIALSPDYPDRDAMAAFLLEHGASRMGD